jgi:hypothetical protein
MSGRREFFSASHCQRQRLELENESLRKRRQSLEALAVLADQFHSPQKVPRIQQYRSSASLK